MAAHYSQIWGKVHNVVEPTPGRLLGLSSSFRVLEYKPRSKGGGWIYATCGMAGYNEDGIELHLVSPRRYLGHADTLAAIAHYHLTEAKINLNAIVNIGISWMDDSICTYGLISLPYLYGPMLENYVYQDQSVKCYWLVPITGSERAYAVQFGVEKLESLFDKVSLDYLNPNRDSVI